MLTQTKTIVYAKNNSKYRLISKFIAGIVLTGNEIKSIRNHQVNINGAYVVSNNNELFIVGMNISNYFLSNLQQKATYNPLRKRKLLLNKSEIKKIIRECKTGGYIVTPLQLFVSDKGWAKLEIALAQHLRKYQIKEDVKDKEIKRKLRQDTKNDDY